MQAIKTNGFAQIWENFSCPKSKDCVQNRTAKSATDLEKIRRNDPRRTELVTLSSSEFPANFLCRTADFGGGWGTLFRLSGLLANIARLPMIVPETREIPCKNVLEFWRLKCAAWSQSERAHG
jgi:hypothetical protein